MKCLNHRLLHPLGCWAGTGTSLLVLLVVPGIYAITVDTITIYYIITIYFFLACVACSADGASREERGIGFAQWR